MTLAVLAASWIVLALLVQPRRAFLSKLGPLTQAVVGLSAALSFILIPIALASVVLSQELLDTGGIGLRNCGRLIWAVLSHPLMRPELSIALVILAIAPVGLVRGAVSAWRSQTASRELARQGRGPVVIVPTAEQFAFTACLLRPRVVVSRGLLDAASPDYREVVLAHEEAHRRGRHPLLLFVAETVARAVPLAPMRWASDTLRFGLEACADDRAARRTADRAIVAEAVAELALATASAAPGFEGDEVRRVRRLLTPARPSRLGGVVVGAAVFSILAFAGGHGAHCATDSLQLLATAQCRLH